MFLDRLGHGLISVPLVNLGGLALLVLVAQTLAWLGLKPWKRASEASNGVAGDSDLRLSVATPPFREPWVWARRVTVTAALVSLAFSPLVLVRHGSGVADPAATLSAAVIVGNKHVVEVEEFGMTPWESTTESSRARLLRTIRSSEEEGTRISQPGSDALSAAPALMPVSLKSGQGAKTPSAKSRSGSARPATSRSRTPGGKRVRSVTARAGQNPCTTRSQTSGSPAKSCVARYPANRNFR